MALPAVALVSAGAIALELLLMRLYAIGQGHHFAAMIISIALLGYGASGTALALLRERLLRHYLLAWQLNAAAFGLSAAFGFRIARGLAIHPFEIAWDPAQASVLVWTYLILMVPFFCAANCIGLAFMRFGGQIGRVYAFDLVGAGLGAAALVALLFPLPPEELLRALIALGFLAAGVAALGVPGRARLVRALGPPLAGLLVAALAPAVAPALSQYKALSIALASPAARVLAERSSPLGLVTVLDNPEVPFRHAPGLSLESPHAPPEQFALFTDGELAGAITRGAPEGLAYLDYTLGALPYALRERPRVLVLGGEGGDAVQLARRYGARSVEVAEPDPEKIALLRGRFAEFAGGVYDPARTVVHLAGPRGALADAGSDYDLIALAALTAGGGGFGAAQETYGATVEALMGYLGRLHPEGLFYASVPVDLPPRRALKLLAGARAALARLGAAEPAAHLALLRGFQSAALLVKKRPFGAQELAALRRFAAERAFDLAYLPGLARAEANRFNRLEAPQFYDGAVALLGPGRAAFLAGYKFDLRPATDDRPYFFDVFKWRSLPELLARARGGTMPLIEWGYLVLLATLVQALIASVVLVLLPLLALRRRGRAAAPGTEPWRVALYFLALGLAFLFVEIAFIQRLTLFLGHPLYAVALVLAAFLVFAGLGAAASGRLAARWPEGARLSALERAVAGIAVLAGLALAGLAPATQWLVTLPPALKVPLAVAAIAPLAFCMGLPFPLGLGRLGREAPGLVPWAWGLNGCASVVSAVLAALLAIEFGFAAVVAAAVALYVVAALVWRRRGLPAAP